MGAVNTETRCKTVQSVSDTKEPDVIVQVKHLHRLDGSRHVCVPQNAVVTWSPVHDLISDRTEIIRGDGDSLKDFLLRGSVHKTAYESTACSLGLLNCLSLSLQTLNRALFDRFCVILFVLWF